MVEKYTGDCNSVVMLANHGFSQSGYEPILSFVEWKALPSTEHTNSDFVRLRELDAHDVGIRLDDLKELVKTMEDKSIDSAYVTYYTDDDHYMQSITLYIHDEIKTPKTHDQYMVSYQYYVNRTHWRNQETYRAERAAADELATYQRLHAKYAGVK